MGLSIGIYLLIFAGFTTLILLGFYILKTKEKVRLQFDNSLNPQSFIKIPSGWTHYELSGSAKDPVVVLIHGGSIPFCIWDPQINDLLQSGFCVLRYDQYGKGLSERVTKEYTRELYTNQLAELLDALKIEKVNLIGPSFGGAIAASFGAQYPDRVNSIIFISPVLNLNHSNSPLLKPINLSRLPIIGRYIFHAVILDKIITRGLNLIKNNPNSDSFKTQFQYIGTEKSFTSTFKSNAYDSYRDACCVINKKIKNILLLRGSVDPEVTAEMICEAREDMPMCSYLELPGSSHSPNSENPDQFNEIIILYLREFCKVSKVSIKTI